MGMARLIDANALLDKVQFRMDIDSKNAEIIAGCVDITRRLIENAPTVDAVEVVHGCWEPRKDVPGFIRCSVCHDCNIYDDWADGKKWNYCPNCGAKLDGGEVNE